MDKRLFTSYLVVAIGAALFLLSTASGQQSGGTYTHPGKVLEIEKNDPVRASVKAWPKSVQTGWDGDCVMYGDAPLDSKVSDGATGRFKLRIGTAQRTYTVTYCASGYHTRVDRDLPNAEDGTPVKPTPAHLWSVKASPSASKKYADEVIRRAVIALNELAYLRSVNADQFKVTFANYAALLSEENKVSADILLELASLAAAWGR